RGNLTSTRLQAACQRGFNGAALVRARKFTSTLGAALRPSPLQWGRARASAEMIASRLACCNPCWLQWGRARASAEISKRPRYARRIDRLQWGRARASAEIK